MDNHAASYESSGYMSKLKTKQKLLAMVHLRYQSWEVAEGHQEYTYTHISMTLFFLDNPTNFLGATNISKVVRLKK